MTAQEYKELEDSIYWMFDEWRKTLCKYHARVVIPPIEQLRKATPDDIRVGSIIYYIDDAGTSHWHIVKEVRYPNDDFKAYVADDGSRYGLHKAWVDK